MRISISRKLIIYFLSISILSIYIVGKFSFNKSRDALINRTFEQLISIRVEKEVRIKNFIDQRRQDLKNIANHADSREILKNITNEPESTVFSKYLSGYLQANNYYENIYFSNLQLNTKAYRLSKSKIYKQSEEIISAFHEHIFPEIATRETYFKEIKDDQDQYALIIGISVENERSEKIGYILLEINYEAIDEIMIEHNQYNGLGNTGEVYLVGSDYLLRSSSRFENNSVFNTSVKTVGVKDAFNGLHGKKKIDDYRNIKVLSSFKLLDIDDLNWVILAEIDYDEAMISVKSVENNIMYLSIIVSLFLLGIIAVVSTNLTSPIRRLQTAVEDISKGEYGKTIKHKPNNEIGDLIEGFNKMTLTLKEQKESLEYEQLIRTTAVINGQERERQRLSREIHDGLAQYILAIKLKLEYAFEKKGEEREDLLSETKILFSETISEIRNISNNLMPAVLNEFGLITAIENLAKMINEGSSLKFSFNNSTLNETFNENLSIYIYRIIQEALNNTIKHANAKHFKISISEDAEFLRLTIKDDGIGFYIEPTKSGGNGILNIKERVNLLSGTINISSSKDKGVKIEIQIPI